MAAASGLSRDDYWVQMSKVNLTGACFVERTRHRADTIYLIVMGGRILAMQSGFAMLEAAFVRPMNSANIMMKNLMDLFAGVVAFYFFGYKIAFGEQAVSWEEEGFDWAIWFLQFSYATTAATIDSGALAGRVSFISYVVLSFVMTGIIYPIVVQWSWGGGWLQDMGYNDFAGGSIVHLVGSVSALVSICICGPRIGKFPSYRAWRHVLSYVFLERNDSEFYQGPQTEVEVKVFSGVAPIHNPVQALFGVFLLLTGFLAFNPASTFSTTNGSDLLAARTSVTTLLMSAGSALACFLVSAVRRRSLVLTIPEFATMTVAGMVASCGCCHVIPPLLAMPIGILAALLADWTTLLLNRLQLDDVVGAVAAHGPPGALGVLVVPLLAKPHCQSDLTGLFFGGGQEAWDLLATQVCGIVTISAFTAGSTYITVFLVDLVLGFRSNRATELIGHDFMDHGYEDGSTTADPNTAIVIQHSPIRDCMRERIVSLHSPRKSFTEEEGEAEATSPAPTATTANEDKPADKSGGPDIVAMEKELKKLREDVHLLTAMLQRTQVGNGVFGPLPPQSRSERPQANGGGTSSHSLAEAPSDAGHSVAV